MFLFACLTRKSTILAKYAAEVGNFSEIVEAIIRQENDNNFPAGFKTYSIGSKHLVHRLTDKEFVFICVADKEEALWKEYLTGIQDKFLRYYASDNDFFLRHCPCHSIPRPRHLTKLDTVREEVDQVRNLAVSNIESIIERGEKLELLIDKTENLSSTSVQFKQTSVALSRRMRICLEKMLLSTSILSNAEDGEKVFTELKTLFNENSDLPDTQFIRENIPDLSISASKWNKGVATAFDGIRNSPSTISYYAVQGKDFVVSSLDGLNATEDKSEDKQ
ncbi:VAMP7 [Lepeophtheirus salmonis]|uniref:Vesicle-associated membrane protein 7 n=1 Tax=Lepeophtheirus salmonis TaxID=72036 RepID=A0A7R8D0F7_LEPSM|nr:VAMP7 [Lepeophtheirus salmonis]CAF2958253.1 VAMP7 [Lepeophtheirus salmonis]